MILYLGEDKLYNKKVVIKESSLNLLFESKNSKRAHQQTRNIIAQHLGKDPNDPYVSYIEKEFEKEVFGEGRRVDWFIILEPNFAQFLYVQEVDSAEFKIYADYIFLKGDKIEKLTKEKANEYLVSCGVENIDGLSFEQKTEYNNILKTNSQTRVDFINQVRQITDFNQLKAFIDPMIQQDKAAAKEQMNNMEVNLNRNYQVLGPLSFDEAKQYGDYSCPSGKICYTQNLSTWYGSNYSNDGQNRCYLLLRNDWKEVQAVHDGSEKNNGLEGLQYNGYDNYGLSMIFVWFTPDGGLYECNTRWNHDADYAPGHSVDSALNEVDIARLMGAPIDKVFDIEILSFEERLVDIENRLANGEDPYILFDAVLKSGTEVENYLIKVALRKKFNFLVFKTKKFLCKEWFDRCRPFREGLSAIMLNGKANYIKTNGEIAFPDKWFDNTESFRNGFGVVSVGNKDTYIKTNGEIAFPNQWYEICCSFVNGFAVVSTKINGMWKDNYINTEGKILTPNQWYDNCGNFANGYATVELNGKSYLIDKNGNITDY